MKITKKLLPFVVYWLVNFIIIYAAGTFFTDGFAFGSANVPTPVLAMGWTALLLIVLCRLAKPLVARVKIKFNSRLRNFILYWGVNSVAIWVLARIPALTGFGIARFYWAIGLGLATNLGQWVTRQVLKATKMI
ncbi:hypothetical protein A2630_00070 [Candidatus Woesebacteria bacterium RIFCSPHIGHO2_01_FULL_44_10]|uniref:Uncharacterized protein n=1 Tax=Candidatus Woesebacteria bacterium RIFCSPLOWO2_01_FULL_44_14 TaxID=1802525 RepID=A0A1F8BZC1_9BACT|nr:MAG: hypothetical protein A2630_00070 [Candidatus Woesebacteria bacterium RIFCSPHIGHO2_01_FULL_44_10]OGM68705.1 MAG: hypothetical protein A2975_05370 [Candidatus Woesebacteria bacterium RIFCSPLOWO2_01_FULL_44_14]